jgi:1-acyl-sn-glycerol-3-phosphate acyltransferase
MHALTIKCVETGADDIVLAPPHALLKTSSGKLRRAACRSRYEQGRLTKPRHPLWQLPSLLTTALIPMSRKTSRLLGTLSYSIYAYMNLSLLAAIAWIATFSLPKLKWRWQVVHSLVKCLEKVTFTQVTVTGRENLQNPQAVIFVANHSSYVDALFLTGLLPKPAKFVAKAELKSNPLLYRPLGNLGVQFVERFDNRQSAKEAQQMRMNLSQGHSLIIFPEGTFTRAPGLLPFHLGAFIAAVKAQVPVIPISLQGTRNILRAQSWQLRRSKISIHVGKPINPSGKGKETHADDWQIALELRNKVREQILEHCGEPDLAYENIIQGARP